MNAAQSSTATSISNMRDESFAFVQTLAMELSGGKVELAGFPDVAVRVQKGLADEQVFTRVNADTALLTGTLHGIGRLYIMTRAIQYPALFCQSR